MARNRFYLIALCLLGVITARVVGAMSPALSAEARSQEVRVGSAPSAQAAPPPTDAGSETCVTCHSDQGDTLKGTKHADAMSPRTPAAVHGCESCHGPGQAHVDDDAKGHIRKFAQMPPGDINQTCLGCHNRGNHAGWEGSAHDRRNLSCTPCHSVHSPKSFSRQL